MPIFSDRKLSGTTKGIGYLLLLLIVGFVALGLYFRAQTVPDYDGKDHVHGITAQVAIDRDDYDIPTISGETDADVYFGLGYAEAQDRMFQMELMRRLGQGRLSEIMGKRTFVVDKWSRSIGFRNIAEHMWQMCAPKTREVLTAFSNGVNAYLAGHRTRLGFEFDALKHVPENWRPQDCLLLGRLMSWELNESYWTDAGFCDISLVLDSTHLRSLFPGYAENGATIIDGASAEAIAARWENPVLNTPEVPAIEPVSQPKLSDSARRVDSIARLKTHVVSYHERGEPDDWVNFIQSVHSIDGVISSILGRAGVTGGSNSIALSGTRTASHGAVLENDTHLTLSAPSRWYLVHLKSRAGLNVAGACIPGIPAILSGRSEYLSWGVTASMADENDFFVETLDSSRTHYLTPRGPKKFVEYWDTIKVKDSVSSNPPIAVPCKFQMTDHGPIVSGVHPIAFSAIYHGKDGSKVVPDTTIFLPKHPVSLGWNGEYALGDELAGWIGMPKAHSIEEARAGLSEYATPTQNLTIADAHTGSIAYLFIGRLPKRSGSEQRLLLPRDGTKASDEWQGFIMRSELPYSKNPSRGYFVSANNPPQKSRTIAYGDNWEVPARAERIAELIERSGPIDNTAMMRIITDVASPYDLHVVLPYLLSLYPDPVPPSIQPDTSSRHYVDSLYRRWRRDSALMHTAVEDSARKALEKQDSANLALQTNKHDTARIPRLDKYSEHILDYLRNWNGAMDPDQVAPSIYAAFYQQLLENTFLDELGKQRYEEFLTLGDVPERTLQHLLRDPKNVWWDDVMTKETENRDSIVKISFIKAIRSLRILFGDDVRTWQWGRLHQLVYHHPFSAASPLLSKLLDIDAGATPGGMTSVAQASYYLADPYKMLVGSSFRLISDMKTNSLFAILPTGNAEAPFGPHYRDMLELWKKGGIIEVPLDRPATIRHHFELLPN